MARLTIYLYLSMSHHSHYLSLPQLTPSFLFSPAFPPLLLGVVDHGIFAGFTTAVIVAGKDGVRVAGAGGEKPWW